MKKVYTGEINKHTLWDGDSSTDGLPVSGSSVEAFIKNTFGKKAGDFYYDGNTTKYIVFADEEDRKLYLSNREAYADRIIGTFDAPANYTAEVNMRTPASNVVLSGAKGNYIDFTFDVKSRTGSSTGEAVVVTYTFNNSGNVKKVTQVYDAGTNVHFLADQYLSDGVNSISVVVTGRSSLASAMAGVSYTMVALSLTSSLNFANGVEKGRYLAVPYHIEGPDVKWLQWYVDGTLDESLTDTITDVRRDTTKDIDTSGLSTGKHNVQARAYMTNGGENFYSATLYFDFVVYPTGEQWGQNTTYVLLGATITTPTTSTISVTAEQYAEVSYKIATYDSRKRTLNVTVTDNGTQVASISTTPGNVESQVYSASDTGSHTLRFSASGASTSMSLSVEGGEIDIKETTDSLLLKLSAKGRNNNETTPNKWTYDTVSATFNGFSWNALSGWNDGALVIPSGASIDISLAPLNGDPTNYGRTVEIDFETSNITDENASIINLTNSSTNAGIKVTASSASLRSSGGTVVETKYRNGDRMHLAFIVNRKDGPDSNMAYIVNNGILERAANYASTDSYRVNDNLHIGGSGCTVKIHSIRVYNKALTVEEAFCNYAVDQDDLINIASNNDILDSLGNISVDKVNAKIPVMIITGDISFLLGINNKELKGEWNTNLVTIEFRNMQDPDKNFTIENADIRLQGTSSISYPRKNFRIYSTRKSNKSNTGSSKVVMYGQSKDDIIENGLYSFKDGSAPVTCWCLKADYAESSGSHNTGVARLWNTLMSSASVTDSDFVSKYGTSRPLRTAAQTWADTYDYPYDVRTTVDGFPIVLFQRNSESSAMTCLGLYNFNNDKSTEQVYGFTALTTGTRTFDNSKVQCFEFLDSDNAIALFKDVSNFDSKWSDAFESRYPDTKTPNLSALKTLATWINSCKDNQSKWNSEKANHFDIPKLAAYYVYLLRFGAVDQTVKNAMLETEDGVHWFFINYDNDTILGIDNASHQFDTWDYDLTSKTSDGGYYYAGKGESVLWKCFEADTECTNLAKIIDQALYSAGMRYDTICQMFDDNQSSQWCQRIYNENGRYKYITPFKDKGSNVLYMLQGDRRSHRHWWLQHRLEKYDNMWGTGTYKGRVIQLRASSSVDIPKDAHIQFVPAISSYYGYSVASTEVDEPTYREAGKSVTSSGLLQATGVGNNINVYNANNLQKFDVHEYISGLAVVNMTAAVSLGGESRLKSLILGDGTNTNSYLTGIDGLAMQSSLEELDIRGYQAITSLDLSVLPNLKIFKAVDSGLTSFAPAAGSTMTSVSLPTTLQAISLNNVSMPTLSYTPNKTLRSVSIQNVRGAFYDKTFVLNWIDALTDAELEQADLTLTGISWVSMTAAQVLKLAKPATHNLRGKVTLSSITMSEYQQLVEAFGPNVFSSDSAFVIDAPAGVLISGPDTLSEGQQGQFTAAAFPVSNNEIKYLLYNGSTLVSSSSDSNGTYREYNKIKLYESTGIVSVGAGLSSDVTVRVRAQVGTTSTYSDYVTFVGKKIVYPNVTISPKDSSAGSSLDRNGSYTYTKTFNPSTFNSGTPTIAWSLSSNASSYCSIESSNDNDVTVKVTNVPDTAVTVTLTCTATFPDGTKKTGTYNISICLSKPASATVSGDSSLDTNDTFTYTVSYTPSNYTAAITNVAWSVSSGSPAIISASDNSSCSLTMSKGNDTATTITLTCTTTFTGGTTVTGTKTISVGVIEAPIEDEWVDLGLPSGTLWCTHNVGAKRPEDAGLYFLWGDTEGHTANERYNFNDDNYNAKGLNNITLVDDELPLANDAAAINMGGGARMPSRADIEELSANVTISNETVNGVNGARLTAKNGNSIFIPFSGYFDGTSLYDSGTRGRYWSSTIYPYNSGAYNLRVDSSNASSNFNNRRDGFTVRGVLKPPKAVDLGIGTLWADMNIGAYNESDAGLYFSWGNVDGHPSQALTGIAANNTAPADGYSFGDSAYNDTPGKKLTTNFTSGDATYDAAAAYLKGSWRMPTKDEIDKLCSECTVSNETVNGVAGKRFTSKTNGNSIFIPFSGGFYGSSLSNSGAYGRFWSSSIRPNNSSYAYRLAVNSSYAFSDDYNRSYGFSVRGVL